MNKFKPGDEVICMDATDSGIPANLEPGAVYTVSKVGRINGQDGTAVLECSNHELFYSTRFALVSAVGLPISKPTLPIDSKARKNYPLHRGCLRYFPAALAGVAKTSKLGNDKHNPGEEMHHARGKSVDHGDCIIRHLVDVEDLLAAVKRGNTTATPEDVLNEVNQMVWRALAFSQQLHEQFGAPLAPGAKE